MKTIAAFLCIVPFALIQATSVPTSGPDGEKLQAESLAACIVEKKANVTKIKEIFKNYILPEDDPEFTDFFLCYWTKAGVILEDGSVSLFQIRLVYPDLIRRKYPTLSQDVYEKLTNDAVEHCQNVPKGDSPGLKGIQLRNCLTKYVISKQA